MKTTIVLDFYKGDAYKMTERNKLDLHIKN